MPTVHQGLELHSLSLSQKIPVWSVSSQIVIYFFFCKESDTEHLRLRTLHSLLQFLSSVITAESNHRHRMGVSHSNETFSEHGLVNCIHFLHFVNYYFSFGSLLSII